MKFQWLKRATGGIYPAIVYEDVGRRIVVRSYDITVDEAVKGLDWLRKAYPLDDGEPPSDEPATAPQPKPPSPVDAVAA